MEHYSRSLGQPKGFGIRKIASYGVVLCFSFALFAVTSPIQEKATTPAQQKLTAPRLPEGPGKATVVKLCSGCHSAENVIGRGRTYDEWEETLVKMAQLGTKGSDEEFYEVLEYLAEHFPKPVPSDKINVNTATAKALETGLELSTKEAEAIVCYREKNGNFKSLEELKKVSGLDAKKLDAKRDRLVF